MAASARELSALSLVAIIGDKTIPHVVNFHSDSECSATRSSSAISLLREVLSVRAERFIDLQGENQDEV